MGTHVRKPGYMRRAVIAWCIFNAVFVATLLLIVYVLGGIRNEWWVQVPLLLAVIVSEWVIMAETIAPIVRDWIKQEEYITDAELEARRPK